MKACLPLRPQMPSFSPGRIVRLKFSNALLSTDLLKHVSNFLLGDADRGVYLYDAETPLNSMSPLAGQLSGGTTISAGRASDWVSALNAFTLETAPILVSNIVPKRLPLARVSTPSIF